MHATLDIDQARFNMIEQQIRPWDVLDQNVLDLLEVVRREEFVPPAHRLLAFTDMEIPLEKIRGSHSGGARMWAPKLEARVLQEVQTRSHDRALEIGTGSGYFAALLAHRCHSVLSVEISPDLKAMAERNLKAAGISNVRVQQGDGARGYGKAGSAGGSGSTGHEHFDIIVLTGSTPVAPQALLDQLSPGGRLFAVVGDAPAMTARLFTRAAHGTQGITAEDLFETVLTPLVNAPQPARFAF